MIEIVGLFLAALIGGGILKVLNDINYKLGGLTEIVTAHERRLNKLDPLQ